MLIQIPLDIPDVEIEKLDTSTKKGFVFTVISTLKGTTCKCCGKSIDKFYGYSKEITLRHLPILEAVWKFVFPPINYKFCNILTKYIKPVSPSFWGYSP